MTDRLLDRAAERGGLDAVTELAQPLPFGVLCELLGLPAEDHDEVAARAAALAAGFAPVVSPAASAAADEAVTWLRGYFGGLLARRRRGAGTDVLSRMRVDDDADGITDDQLADNAIFLILAGLETSINLLTTGCLALARHPDQAAVLRADPTLVPGAVEEFLRYDAPTRMTARLATAPIEVDGRTIREGRVILLLIGSANHDERVFDQPERLDVSRRPNRHLSFGAGIHHCLGAALARMQSAVVFDRLVRRFPVIEPAGAPTRDAGIGQRSYATAPLRMEPAR
jgi:cytochrome P450